MPIHLSGIGAARSLSQVKTVAAANAHQGARRGLDHAFFGLRCTPAPRQQSAKGGKMGKVPILMVLALLACSGDTPTAVPKSTNIVVTSGAVSASGITVTLKNTGGPGSYYLEFFGSNAPTIYKCDPALPCNPPPPGVGQLIGSSVIASVRAAYQETLAFNRGAFAVRALSRDDNSAVFRITSCLILSTSQPC